MSKSEKLWQKHLKRITEPIGIVDDWEGLREYLKAALEEALEEQKQHEKAKLAKKQATS